MTSFWDVTLCSPVKVHGRFRGTYYHLFGLFDSVYGGKTLLQTSDTFFLLRLIHVYSFSED
jgi:hypothetical protein